MRVLLHACCGPCLLEPYRQLAREHEVQVIFANPNIQPSEEYVRRRDALMEHCAAHGIEVREEPYDPEAWDAAVGESRDDPGLRCVECYRLRIGVAARIAAECGFDAVATTLTVSPYQDQQALARVAEEACRERGIRYLKTDFRGSFRQGVETSKQLGMYRQDYCGCLPSKREAEAQRASRPRRGKRT